MLIKLTEKCSMGCSHCMNDAKVSGRHMSEETLDKALKFIFENDLGNALVVSGGEPTEHPDFVYFMNKIIRNAELCHLKTLLPVVVSITTNGFWILDHQEEALEIVNRSTEGVEICFQVSTDSRYYPQKLPLHKRIFREKGFVLCPDCVESMYPQGRARANNYPFHSKASRCYNVRSLANQLPEGTLTTLVGSLLVNGKFCTPHIKYDGGIGLGESDLCPAIGTVEDNPSELYTRIKDFSCPSCEFLNKALPEQYRQFIKFTEE